MEQPIEKVQKLAHESGVHLKQYVESNPPKAFSGGKVKFREYTELVERMDRTINDVEESLGMESSCRKGCAACCNHSIIANGFEVELVLNYLERNNDFDTIQKVKQKIADVAEVIDKKFGPAPKNPYEMEKYLQNEQEIKKEYFELNLKCPLLSEENTCMVYPVRPSPCWSYRVYGDPNDCEKTHDIPHSIVYVGHEKYYLDKKNASIEAGSIPRRPSYHLAGFLPQKLRDSIR